MRKLWCVVLTHQCVPSASEVRPLGLVPGQRDRRVVGPGRLTDPAQSAQQVGPNGVEDVMAAQIQLVDLSPEQLRRRLAHGNVYRAEQIDASMSSFFRVGNLTALRELALLWLADRVDEGLAEYRRRQDRKSVV